MQDQVIPESQMSQNLSLLANHASRVQVIYEELVSMANRIGFVTCQEDPRETETKRGDSYIDRFQTSLSMLTAALDQIDALNIELRKII